QKNQHWLEQHLKRLEVLSQVLDESPTSLIDYISEIQQISQVRYSLFAERDTDNRFHTRVVFDSGYLQDNFTCHLSWAEFEIPLWSNKNQGCQFVPGHHFPDSVKQLVDWPINSGCLITLHPIQNEMDGIMLLLHDKTLPLSSTQVLFVNLYLGRLLQYQIYQKQQKKLKNIPQKLSEEEKMAIFASDAESFTVVAPISSIEAPKDIPSTHKNTIALRVLVAEDSIINQAVIQKMLKHLGHNVDVAENGLVVLDKLQKQDYDLILMDCQMPELDGYATTRKIRHLEKQQQSLRMPIIALTAHALDEHRIKAIWQVWISI
ncbi:response regulator, partial [Candidatus Venteria ishoeyi]|uniref:response regulator n=1 Tax=Candidatus Venteria ishoeyi TaxID=1899563 RepID=UPI00255CB3D2